MWNETENHNGAHVAVINRTLAQRYFPKGDAIGHSLKLPGIEDRPPELLSAPNIADSWLQIVGIVEDARNDGLRNPIKPAVYVPYTLSMSQGTQILVRSEVPPLTLLHAVRAQLTAVNRNSRPTATSRIWKPGSPMSRSGSRSTWRHGFLAYLRGWPWLSRQWGFTAWCPTRWRNGQTSLGFAWRWAHSAACDADRLRVDSGERGQRDSGRSGAHAWP